ncbi:ferrous-iron efflux pump FieF [mine drainage metagenome]|uniref:Ferrous-iron efflux pump FieF n=1 Tax=mine drainage metagenome TaxID=410659 RepID=A0A1J5REE7_9ZZZZ
MSADLAEKEKAGRMMRRATLFAVAVGVILIVAKLTAWLGTGSVALLSTLIDSTLDSIASLVNLLAVHHALSPADAEHRFGHGKAEPLAGLAQSAFIGGSGLLLIGEAAQRLWEPQPVTHGLGGIAVMGLSIVLTLALVTYQKRVIARTQSVAISADRLHYASDLMMNAGVIVSLLLSAHLGWTFIDPLFALGIACYILWGAGKLAWGSFNLLMDREFPPEDRSRIKAICEAHPFVRNVHDLRTRSAGQADFIQLHLVLDGEMSLRRAHDISDAVEAEIRAAFPRADIIIHQDPDGLAEPRKDFDEE